MTERRRTANGHTDGWCGRAVRPIGVALYGLGNVGGGLVQVMEDRRKSLAVHHGVELSLRHVVVRDPVKRRTVPTHDLPLTTDIRAPLNDGRVDVVIEAMGGIDPANTVIREALDAGRNVVTANKALIARNGADLEVAARRQNALLRFGAAVGGSIPILHTLRGALVGSRILRIRGILNGTTNFVLSRMTRDGLALVEALAEARALGYAEADPAADLSGLDAARKLVILAWYAFGGWLKLARVQCRGIDAVTPEFIQDAVRRGRVVKLVAEASRRKDGTLDLAVRPRALRPDDPLAGAEAEFNAIEIEGDFSGPLLFRGRGAGGRATASALYADLVAAALRIPERAPARSP